MRLRPLLALPAAALAAAAGVSTGATAGGPAATGLRATPECAGAPPRPVVHLRWTPSGAGRQRVQVAVVRDGFRTGDFERSRRLPAERRRLDWHRARGEAQHHWRVVTRNGGRRARSEIAQFTGPGCVGADPPAG